MELQSLRNLYEHSGPFVTVYLEGRSPAADSSQQVRLRWNELREQLSEQGAGEETLTAIDGALSVDGITEIQTDGRVLVADASGVVLNEHWDAALGAGDAAHLSDQPALGAYVRELTRSVSAVLVVADQAGALVREIRIAPQHKAVDTSETQIEGDSDDQSRIHKPREGALSHNQIRRHADELIKDNAREVADLVDRLVSKHSPDAVVIAGEVQGRTAVKSVLGSDAEEIAVEVSRGGIVDEAAEGVLYGELERLATDIDGRRRTEAAEVLSHGRAHDRVVEGRQEVAKVAGRGAVETLLLDYENGSEAEDQILADVIRSSGGVDVIDGGAAEGIAATLRFDVAAALAD